ncbi:MAG: hypothetical protein H5T59_01995 [Anaerolineae bacterium]|nr:hypothetical protein [Anaerolineae bacterium]
MRCFGMAALADFLGDFVVYRNLDPVDPRLPRLADVAPALDLPPGHVPRKSEPAYARVIAHILQAAQELSHPGVPLQRLVYLGDTRLLDSTAFRNLKAAMGLPGWAFIATENLAAPAQMDREDDLWVANRWRAVEDFLAFLAAQGFPLDEGTAVVVDMDKTAIGARGRNDKMIDQARVAAVRRTVEGTLGDAFQPDAFQEAYDTLNQPRYHPFTADNQDYLAYICLMVSAGLCRLPALLEDLAAGRLETFAQFITQMDERLRGRPQDGLVEVHRQVWEHFRRGDPTPFKAFRRNEYLETVARMGHVDKPEEPATLLRQEIVITQEIRTAAEECQARGALLFGLTDKPDEASLPAPDLAARACLPVHQVRTHAVGEG